MLPGNHFDASLLLDLLAYHYGSEDDGEITLIGSAEACRACPAAAHGGQGRPR